MSNFDKAEAIEDLYHCHDKRDLAKMVVKLEGDIQEMVAKAAANKLDGYRELSERACKAEEELARCQRMYANACATLGEIQGYPGNDIVGIEPALVKQLIDERDELAAHIERVRSSIPDATTRPQDALRKVVEVLRSKPETSLTHRDLIKQAEALERAINVMKQPMTDGGHPWLVRVEDIEAMAAVLRDQAKEVGQ